jgi:hypothetical protein
VKDLDGDMLKIKDRLKNNILSSHMGLFDVWADLKEGRNIINITVASGPDKPYYKKNMVYRKRELFLETERHRILCLKK